MGAAAARDAAADGARPWLLFVTGAPGAGKSSVVKALVAGREAGATGGATGRVLVFDADWLLEPASALAGHDLTRAGALWPQYRGVWLRFLEMVARNGASAALFTPMDPGSLPRVRWPVNVDWCLLDCDDATRTARLEARGWMHEAIEDALSDARALQGAVANVIDTSRSTPAEAAALLARWFEAHR